MNRLRSYLIGMGCGLCGFASAAAIPLLTGPIPASDMLATFNSLIRQINSQMGSYITFSQNAAETGEMAFSSAAITSGTSFAIVLPNGTVRWVQTSATP